MTVDTWDPKKETLAEHSRREAEARHERLVARKTEALFRLGLSQLDWSRYAIGVEHYRDRLYVHGYIVCKQCYRLKAGVVDPRTSVMNTGVTETLIPKNMDLTVGLEMMEAVHAILAHEQEHHRARQG